MNRNILLRFFCFIFFVSLFTSCKKTDLEIKDEMSAEIAGSYNVVSVQQFDYDKTGNIISDTMKIDLGRLVFNHYDIHTTEDFDRVDFSRDLLDFSEVFGYLKSKHAGWIDTENVCHVLWDSEIEGKRLLLFGNYASSWYHIVVNLEKSDDIVKLTYIKPFETFSGNDVTWSGKEIITLEKVTN